MRIIGGTAAGITLQAPKGLAVRPTIDLVKQALFNSLGERVIGTRVLELFAGTGALGLESLSRGAAHAVCVELSHKHAGFIRRNLETAKLPASALELRIQDVFAALQQFAETGRQFDLIMADPPFGPKNVNKRSESFAQKLIDDPNLLASLTPDGLLVLGHARRDTLTITPAWRERKALKHGDSMVRFLEKAV